LAHFKCGKNNKSTLRRYIIPEVIHIQVSRGTVSRALSEWRSPILRINFLGKKSRGRDIYLTSAHTRLLLVTRVRHVRLPCERGLRKYLSWGRRGERDKTTSRDVRDQVLARSHRSTRDTYACMYVWTWWSEGGWKESSGDIRVSTTRADDSEAHAASDLLLRSSSRRRRSARSGWG